MIECKELNTTFETEKELFNALIKNKDEIIGLKKANIMKSCEKGLGLTAKPLDYSKITTQVKNISLNDNHYYIAVNSTRILDSHKDLHLDNIWNKSVKDLQGKNYLVDSHELSISKTIVKREHIKMFTAIIPFSMIGKSYQGETEVLIYQFPKEKVINQIAKEWLESGDSIEGSVKMRYTDITLAMKSEEEEHKEELKNYEKYNPIIANKEDFDEEIKYFWAIKQAMNVHESSLVLFGSNNATGQVSIEHKQEQLDNTLEIEAAKALQKKKEYLLNLN